MTEILATIGIKLKVLIPGALGATVSLIFFPGLAKGERTLTCLGGVSLAVYGATPVVDWLELKESAEIGFALLLGLFGMSIVAAIIKVIRDTDWSGIVKSKSGG